MSPKKQSADLAPKFSRGNLAATQIPHRELRQSQTNLACRGHILFCRRQTRRRLIAARKSHGNNAQTKEDKCQPRISPPDRYPKSHEALSSSQESDPRHIYPVSIHQ
jgi:hypothetical protein